MDLVQTVKDTFELYRSFNNAHPLLGSMTTSVFIFPTADIVSQYITNHRIDWRKVRYTTALSPVYGAATYGCVQSKELVPEGIQLHKLAQAVATNLVGGILFNGFFFINNTVGERTGYNVGKLVQHYTSIFLSKNGEEKTGLKDRVYSMGEKWYEHAKEKMVNCIPYQEYAKAFLGSITLWNGFQFANYSYIPQELQTPSTLAMAFVWTVALSAWSLAGRRRLAGAELTVP